jgi:hypothetical protein
MYFDEGHLNMFIRLEEYGQEQLVVSQSVEPGWLDGLGLAPSVHLADKSAFIVPEEKVVGQEYIIDFNPSSQPFMNHLAEISQVFHVGQFVQPRGDE